MPVWEHGDGPTVCQVLTSKARVTEHTAEAEITQLLATISTITTAMCRSIVWYSRACNMCQVSSLDHETPFPHVFTAPWVLWTSAALYPFQHPSPGFLFL